MHLMKNGSGATDTAPLPLKLKRFHTAKEGIWPHNLNGPIFCWGISSHFSATIRSSMAMALLIAFR